MIYGLKFVFDFAKTNLTDGDWAKFFIIPAHTFVIEVMTNIITVEGAASGVIGDTSADHSDEWLATSADRSSNRCGQ